MKLKIYFKLIFKIENCKNDIFNLVTTKLK
jgi:hypothetical protein